ncbi:adhesin [Methanobrevibacter sp.]|uniref:adhesin n=1 Tax=Methanobrevibacter sp. TaxID=66852 RepID=UPI00388D1F3F
MNFKNIYLITIIILAIFSISAISAEEIADADNGVDIIGSDVNVADDIISADIIDENNVILTNSSDLGGEDSNSTDSNETDENSTDDNQTEKSSIESSDLTKYYKNDTQFEATFYDVDGNPLVNQTVPVKINGVTYNRTTKDNGSIRFVINLAPGNYVIELANPATGENASNNITVLPTISGENLEKFFRNASQYYATILNGQGMPAANTIVTFNINGVFYNRTSNANGTAKLNINLNPGKYVITATNTLNGDAISNNITVLSTIQGKDISKYFKNDTQYYANFTDGQGNPLANTTIQFNINGVLYDRKTNANGTAKLNINLNPGTYVITAYNTNTSELKSNTIKVLSTIVVKNSNSGGNISMEYNNSNKFTVELHYNNGTLAKNKEVSFNINGVFYKRTSNENGTASLNINLIPGNYIITSEFDGCVISNIIKIRISPTIKLVNATVKVGQPIQFYLHEKNSGNPITSPHYGILYYNGTTYGAYPDANGLVSFTQTFINNGQNFTAGSNPFCLFGTLDDGYYSSLYNGNTIRVVE